MDPKPLTLRPMPDLKQTLAQLRESTQYAERSPLDKWRRHAFFAAAQSILKHSAASKLVAPTDWQNQTMTDAYLTGRESLALFSNISYLFEAPSAAVSAIERAANLTHRALMFHAEVKAGTLPAEVEAGYLLESEQYPYFFGTSRLPGDTRDERLYAPNSRHFVVALRGQFYRIALGSELPTCADLAATFKAIVQAPSGNEPKVGLLTALSRPEWARLRRRLATSPVNATTLKSLDEALFIVALDLDRHCEHRTAAMRHLILGDYANRWFDKSHQLIVTGDGTAGINRDHSFLDGHPTLRYVQYLNAELESRCDSGKAMSFELVPWSLDKSLSETIADAENKITAETEQFYIDTWDSSDLGLREAKSFGLNADFVMQAAIHMACYKVFGRFMNSTEAVHMRHTVSGRYDSILTLTPAMAALVSKFTAANLVDRRRLMAAGQEAHRDRVKACKKGQSPILHLMALLASNNCFGPLSLKADGIYWGRGLKVMDAPWQDITSCTVTTSHPGARPGLECSGFTDTFPGVVGVSYLVKADRTTIYLKADHDKLNVAAAIKTEMEKALRELTMAASKVAGA